MSNDERMIRVENACMEQAIRIEALEKRTYNLPKTDAYNRLVQRIEALESKVQWCESEIGAIYSADENWQKTWGQWREKHNELCDVVDSLTLNALPRNPHYFVDMMAKARIPTGDKEAQDETASDNARVENNTVGNTLRSNDLVCDGDTFDAQLEALRDTFSEILRLKYGGSVEGRYEPVTELLNALRPHLEQWAHKVAEAEAKLMGIDLVVSGCVAPEIVDKRLDCAAYRNACELRKERDALKAEVARLRDLLKAMPHLGEAHEGYVQAVNETLAEGNDNG